jgi:putative ABC transport system substrate-binding protein
MAIHVRRREFIALLGGVTALPLAARAQQPMPVIGFLSSGSPESDTLRLTAFQQGLKETGYVEKRNVAIEYRGMQGHYDLLPALITDFVRRPVAVIVAAGTTPGALAAKAATGTIPIVFQIGADPIEVGLVAGLNRPGENITGVSNLSGPVAAKRLEFLRELKPTIDTVAVLVNPSSSLFTQSETKELRNAANSLGLQLHILNASTGRDIETAFANLAQIGVGGLLISAEAFFYSRRLELVALTARQALPTMYAQGEYVTSLISYGFNYAEVYRQVGIYAGRILQGAKPSELPVQQATKIELLINLKTAKALGLDVPPTLLARADEVIE